MVTRTFGVDGQGREIGGSFLTVSQVITRQANTTAYAAGALIGASPTILNAGNYLVFGGVGSLARSGVCIPRIRVHSSVVGRKGTVYLVHLFRGIPVLGVADGGVFNTSGTLACDIARHFAEFSVTLDRGGTDGAKGIAGTPVAGSYAIAVPDDGDTLYGVLENNSGSASGSGEVYTITLELAR
jgi:hypothetical protein